MKAVLYEDFGAPPRVVTLPDPSPSPDGVVVRVEASGLCRSDWHGWMGHDPDITPPHVPGHELAGVIEAVGANVRHWRIGDRVTVPFVAGCGGCGECASGNQQICPNQFQPGFTGWGSFAEYVALDYADTNLVRLPDAIASDAAASLGCRFATSFRVVVDQGRVKAGEWLAVHGCGGVGLSAIAIGHALGARVIAVDIHDDKLDLARSLGAEVAIRGGDVPGEIADVTNGGAHVSIDALGHRETCRNSILSLRRRGRHVQVGLLAGDQADPPLPMSRVIGWELALLGSHGLQAHRYSEMLGLILSGKVDPERLISRRIGLADAPVALMDLPSSSEAGVTVITEFV
ncbi:MAG: zinc-dependent alcohol dehydrogenase family protein [Proteobacteria bacterium]|nr:zinc-dependent alcohol dehydrogenase family protein [Pseudomonadota bacterium]